MNEVNNLIYSDEASATRYLFYKDTQDINIFIEDKDKEYEYEIIFSSLMPELKFTTIFASGGKTAMKECFSEFGMVDADNPSHPNIYIVDGDFDRIIFPDDMIVNKHFIYLNAYNIENYLINEEACVKFSMGKLELSHNETKRRINYQYWYSNIINQAKELFFIYCYLQMYHPTIRNVGNGPYIFIDSNTGLERSGALISYKQNLIDNNGIDIEHEFSKIDDIKAKFQTIYGEEYWHLICGKFLLTSLMKYLCSKNVKPICEKDLRWWLINNLSKEPLQYLVDDINDIILECKRSDV